ncbi:40S ribosomal protein S6 [Paramarasmius palmivorus]|uniref:40S ribosomal protein S6 n=1 Tax=Paramarasmius palmivorus TaxID=297713 RepID=A0AAW0ECB8_9AGAR
MPAYFTKAPSDLACLLEEIPGPAGDQMMVSITIAALFTLALFLYRLLRRLYPCLTIVELNKAETSLDVSFDDAVKNDYLRGSEREVIGKTRLCLKNKASQIRTQSLEVPASIWKKCFNVEAELFSDIIGWYVGAEALQREIAVRPSNSPALPLCLLRVLILQTIVELEKRYRYNIELGRRTMVATNV